MRVFTAARLDFSADSLLAANKCQGINFSNRPNNQVFAPVKFSCRNMEAAEESDQRVLPEIGVPADVNIGLNLGTGCGGLF